MALSSNVSRSNRFYYSDDDDAPGEDAPLLQLEDVDVEEADDTLTGSSTEAGSDDVEERGDERQRLLSRGGAGGDDDGGDGITKPPAAADSAGSGSGSGGVRWESRWYQARSPAAVVAVITAMLFGMTLSATVLLIPLARLIEADLCGRYYGTRDPIDERKCKVDDVQAQLAWLGGMSSFLDAVVSLAVSFPWGILSDRFGRKPIFRISFFSIFLNSAWGLFVVRRPDLLPVEFVLIGHLFSIFGGGPTVAVNVINSIVADVSTEKASAFVWISVGAVAGAVTGPAFAAKLMESFTPWVPIWISGGIIVSVFFAIGLLPETRPKPVDSSSTEAPEFGPGNPRTTGGSVYDTTKGNFWAATKTKARRSWTEFRSSLAMFRSLTLLCIAPAFFVQSPATTVQGMTLGQTISKKFGWTLARTGYFFSARGLLTVLALVLLPLVARPSSFRRDLFLSRISILLIALGNLGTGFLDLLPVFIVGQLAATLAIGSGSLTRSLAARLVTPDQTSRLYALTGMAETLGQLVSGPSLAWIFGNGVKAGGPWMGLPFWYVSVQALLALVALSFIRRPAHERDGRSRSVEDGEAIEGEVDGEESRVEV